VSRERKSPLMCGKTHGMPEEDEDGDVHVHACTRNKGHGGKHKCTMCGYEWQ